MTQKELSALRTAVADYMSSEGCSCCQDYEKHDLDKRRLGELLDVPMYEDGSGYDFTKFGSVCPSNNS